MCLFFLLILFLVIYVHINRVAFDFDYKKNTVLITLIINIPLNEIDGKSNVLKSFNI